MRTLLWSYLGWRRFPRDMRAFEVRHFFSFSVADRRELRVRYPRRLRLGAALQVGFVRMTGTTLDSFDYVPNAVLKHVARTLALPAPDIATLRALYQRDGGYILRSEGAEEVEFVVVNLFDSIESVRRFAGDDYATPVLEPEARLLLSRIEPIARHYEVRASTV